MTYNLVNNTKRKFVNFLKFKQTQKDSLKVSLSQRALMLVFSAFSYSKKRIHSIQDKFQVSNKKKFTFFKFFYYRDYKSLKKLLYDTSELKI